MNYSKEQIKKALELYQQCKFGSQTVHILGYPTRGNLYKWINLLKEAKISRSMSVYLIIQLVKAFLVE